MVPARVCGQLGRAHLDGRRQWHASAIDDATSARHFYGMKKTIKMDRSGRVVLPLAMREKYGLVDGGHRLEIFESPDGIVLRPRPEEIPVERHASGWVVFRSGEEQTVDLDQAVEEEREHRHRQVRGDQ